MVVDQKPLGSIKQVGVLEQYTGSRFTVRRGFDAYHKRGGCIPLDAQHLYPLWHDLKRFEPENLWHKLDVTHCVRLYNLGGYCIRVVCFVVYLASKKMSNNSTLSSIQEQWWYLVSLGIGMIIICVVMDTEKISQVSSPVLDTNVITLLESLGSPAPTAGNIQLPDIRQVHICQAREAVLAKTRFAVVSLLSRSAPIVMQWEHYLTAAAKLGTSVRKFSEMDMVMLAVNVGDVAPALVGEAGWMWCPVPVNTHSKLWIWDLTEYDGVLFLNVDCLVLSNFTTIFTEFLPDMYATGQHVGMALDGPQARTNNCLFTPSASSLAYNSGVVLAIPSVSTLDHQIHVNESFNFRSVYTMPWFFNYNIVSFCCDSTPRAVENIVVMQFTVAKPWQPDACWYWDIMEQCEMWQNLPVTTLSPI